MTYSIRFLGSFVYMATFLFDLPVASALTGQKIVQQCDPKLSDNNGRRSFLVSSTGVLSSVLLFGHPSAFAAVSQEEKDKQNILKGYARLQYLLDNWEKETTG